MVAVSRGPDTPTDNLGRPPSFPRGVPLGTHGQVDRGIDELLGAQDDHVAKELADALKVLTAVAADSGGFRTAVPDVFVHRFWRFSYTPREAGEHPRLS
jgi:hypothetical protein